MSATMETTPAPPNGRSPASRGWHKSGMGWAGVSSDVRWCLRNGYHRTREIAEVTGRPVSSVGGYLSTGAPDILRTRGGRGCRKVYWLEDGPKPPPVRPKRDRKAAVSKGGPVFSDKEVEALIAYADLASHVVPEVGSIRLVETVEEDLSDATPCNRKARRVTQAACLDCYTDAHAKATPSVGWLCPLGARLRVRWAFDISEPTEEDVQDMLAMSQELTGSQKHRAAENRLMRSHL